MRKDAPIYNQVRRFWPDGRHNQPEVIQSRHHEISPVKSASRQPGIQAIQEDFVLNDSLPRSREQKPPQSTGLQLVLIRRRGRTYFVERIRAHFQAADDLWKGSVVKDSGILARPAAY
jgi:hypothetical protein